MKSPKLLEKTFLSVGEFIKLNMRHKRKERNMVNKAMTYGVSSYILFAISSDGP